MLREVKDFFLHFLVECSEERRGIYLFEELNLFIIPSFKSYKWAVDITFGCTVYQKEGEGILSKSMYPIFIEMKCKLPASILYCHFLYLCDSF